MSSLEYHSRLGSVLGPLLFLVLIGDIDREVATSFVSSFADDTRAVKGISTNADVCDLQVDLDAIYHWADENIMEFNNTKFECLRYGCNNDLKACTSYKAKSGEWITEVDHAKDLGVTLSSNGNLEHLKNVLSTANQLYEENITHDDIMEDINTIQAGLLLPVVVSIQER